MSEQNKSIACRFFEEVSKGNIGVVDQLVASDACWYIPQLSEPVRGRDGIKSLIDGTRGAFPDFRVTVQSQIAEGEVVVSHVTARGTHDGPFGEVPATGKEVEWPLVHVQRVVDGQITEDRVFFDQLGLMQQLGLLPQS